MKLKHSAELVQRLSPTHIALDEKVNELIIGHFTQHTFIHPHRGLTAAEITKCWTESIFHALIHVRAKFEHEDKMVSAVLRIGWPGKSGRVSVTY